MKKQVLHCILCILLVCVLAGCQQSVGPEETTAPAVQVVHTMDELIAAIAPDTEIQLAEGTFDLTTASTYGQRSGNPYVKWYDMYDGFQLIIHDLDNLTIRGSGKDSTSLEAKSVYADVLVFEDCTGIRLEGFTAGHAEPAEGCNGSVVSFKHCDSVKMNQLGLFGSGAVGVQAHTVTGMTLLDSEIYDCSSSGVNFYECQDVTIENCSFHEIGKMVDEYPQGYTVLSFAVSGGINVSHCSIENNLVSYLLLATDCPNVRLTDNRMTDNTAITAMMYLYASDVVMESSNVMENNQFSKWYDMGWDAYETAFAKDENGNPLFTEDVEPKHQSAEPAVSTPVIEGEQKQVKVATVDEFLAAIDSNTEIVLTGKLYDLSTAADYGTTGGKYYSWEDNFDGPGLIITGVENFSIVSKDDLPEKHTISALPRYANVLTFRNCKNIMVKGFTAGHTVEPGSCAGGVLEFESCTNILVENCNLYGCGILGVTGIRSDNLQIINSNIYECSYGGLNCIQCSGITIGGCDFWDLGGPTFSFTACTNVAIEGKEVNGFYVGD